MSHKPNVGIICPSCRFTLGANISDKCHPCRAYRCGHIDGYAKGRAQGREELLALLRSNDAAMQTHKHVSLGLGVEFRAKEYADWLEAKLREGVGK